MKRYRVMSCMIFLFMVLSYQAANASVLSNDNYSVENHTIDIRPFKPADLIKPKEQTSQTSYSGTNYTVHADEADAFSVSISQDVIDFGTLSTTNPVIRTTDLTITSKRSYAVLIAENHPLRSAEGNIPDTTCDNGSCSEITPALWTNTLTYGFGYRCDHGNCEPEFEQSDYYKQFADSTKAEMPQVVSSGLPGKNKKTKITYKVNISGTQEPGGYSNNIFYIAMPNL